MTVLLSLFAAVPYSGFAAEMSAFKAVKVPIAPVVSAPSGPIEGQMENPAAGSAFIKDQAPPSAEAAVVIIEMQEFVTARIFGIIYPVFRTRVKSAPAAKDEFPLFTDQGTARVFPASGL